MNATALAAMTCISGPPCIPGKMFLLSAAASAALHMIIPPRGPRSVLWVVVVTRSQYGTGEGCSPAAMIPAGWAMSAIRRQPTSSAISLNWSKCSVRG